MWRVADGDTEIWLLGTIHALPSGVEWQTPAIAHALATADTLVTEIPPAPPAASAATFARYAGATGLPPISQRVGASQHEALGAAAEAAGVSVETLNGLRTWAAAVTLAGGPIRATGASSEHGLEETLAARFAGRAHRALETQAGQLALFNALPEDAQRRMLARTLSDPGDYDATVRAWETGDVGALAARLEPGFRDAPDLQRVLVTDRNRRWTAWIARRMRVPGRVLVAVGAGHLVGRDSVIAMLVARGLRVQRVQ